MMYIIVEVDYVSKRMEAIALPKNKGKSITTFLKKNIFSRFGRPRAIISDDGSHFCNKLLMGDWRNLGFSIMCLLLIIQRLAGKLRCPIERSSKFL